MLAAAVVSVGIFSGVLAWGQVAAPGAPAAPPAPAGVPGAGPGGAPDAAPGQPPAAQPPAAPVRPVPATPARAAQKLAKPGGDAAAPALVPGAKQKQTFLGLNTSAPTAALREEIKIGVGVGRVVEAVDAGGPAEKAGLQPRDVIEKIDDQLLVNNDQFVKLIRTRNPGDVITLTVYRDGKPQTLTATLGQKEVDAEPVAMAGEIALDGGNDPVALQRDQARLLWKRFDAGGGVALDPAQAAPPQLAFTRKAFVRNAQGKQQTQWADEEHTIDIERENGNTVSMVITDKKTGKKLFEAKPPDEKALEKIFEAVPALRDKVKQADKAAQNIPGRFGGAIIDNFQFDDGKALNLLPPGQAGGGGFGGGGAVPRRIAIVGGPGGARGKVSTWQDDDHLFVMRMVGNKPIYLLALSRKDGRTMYDGPVMTEEQRRGLPADVAEQFELLAGKPELAKEFGGQAEKNDKGEKAVKPENDAAPKK
jgi:hypothetical protein